MSDNLARRRHVLFTMLTVFDFRYAPGPEPPLIPASAPGSAAGPASAASSPA